MTGLAVQPALCSALTDRPAGRPLNSAPAPTFESVMAGLAGPNDRPAADRADKSLADLAVEFVGMAFFAPMLAQARRDPFRQPMFHGGLGEDVFAQRLDEELAGRLARQDRTGLVGAIVARYTQAAAPAGNTSASTTSAEHHG